MRPTRTHETNFTLKHPDPERGVDLECTRRESPEDGVTVSSAWCLDQSERALVAAGGLIEFTAHGFTHPPVSFRVVEPSCLKCERLMVMELQGEGEQRRYIFRCPDCGATKN